MKRLICYVSMIALAMCVGCAEEQPIRLAFITGMNPVFNYEMYEPLLSVMPDVTWKAYTNEESQELFKPEHAGDYDVIVFMDICLDEFPEASRNDLVKVVSEGKPVFILHDGLLTYNTWPEFAHIAGMKYFMSAQDMDGEPYGVSTYKHNQVLPIKVADKKHFITKDLPDSFAFNDEIYGKLWKSPDLHPLWITDHPDSEPIVMYTHQYGKANIVGIVTGHGPDIFKDINFQTAFGRSIRWLAK